MTMPLPAFLALTLPEPLQRIYGGIEAFQAESPLAFWAIVGAGSALVLAGLWNATVAHRDSSSAIGALWILGLGGMAAALLFVGLMKAAEIEKREPTQPGQKFGESLKQQLNEDVGGRYDRFHEQQPEREERR